MGVGALLACAGKFKAAANRRASKPLALVLLSTLATGCGIVYTPTGKVISHYASDHVVPYVKATDDPDLATCGTGLGQNHFVASFSRVMDDPAYVMFYNNLLSGYCADSKAAEANLRYLRARRAGNVAEASDARTEEKRWHTVTAKRRQQAFQEAVSIYALPDSGECPRLRDDSDQITYLLALVTGLQAVQSDFLSGAQVGVPRNIAINAGRAAECLDNEKWWGVPRAIQATVWNFVPGTTPEGVSPWRVYEQSAELAERSGMRLALALWATGAQNQGNDEQLRLAMRAAGAIDPASTPEEYRLIDRLATVQLRHLSDQVWTEMSGERTPMGALGRFPDDAQENVPDTEGLL